MTTIDARGTLRRSRAEDSRKVDERWGALAERLSDMHLDPGVLWTARELVQMADGLDAEGERYGTLLGVLLFAASRAGHTRVPKRALRELGRPADQLLGAMYPNGETQVDVEELADELLEFVDSSDAREWLVGGSADEHRPIVAECGALYIDRLATEEADVGELLGERIGAAANYEVGAETIEEVVETYPFALEDDDGRELRERLRTLTSRRLALLVGGPGTGKTTMVFSLLRVLMRTDLEPEDIALAAPTGKAARRMWESIRQQCDEYDDDSEVRSELDEMLEELAEPSTVHRLLAYSPTRREFRRNATDTHAAEVVVVDEASMIDQWMMRGLLRGIRSEAQLILVGDHQQLPSVGPGAVLRDLEKMLSERGSDAGYVRLEKVHRSDETITDLADFVVNADESGESAAANWAESGPAEFRELEGEEDYRRFASDWFDRIDPSVAFDGEAPFREKDAFRHTEEGGFTEEAKVRLEALFEHDRRFQVLAPTRYTEGRGPAGVEELNDFFHRQFRGRHVGESGRGRYHAGEPVLVVDNDYDYRLFNGERGIVLFTLRPSEGGAKDSRRAKKRVVFETTDGYRALRIGRIQHILERGWATTVHKAQGSEFEHVALVLPSRDRPLVNQRTLYTAVTRAEERVTVAGSRELWRHGIRKVRPRQTGLVERLGKV